MRADRGPQSLFTCGKIFLGFIKRTNDLSSFKLECSEYGNPYCTSLPRCLRCVLREVLLCALKVQPVGLKAITESNLVL